VASGGKLDLRTTASKRGIVLVSEVVVAEPVIVATPESRRLVYADSSGSFGFVSWIVPSFKGAKG
jgi:hypothetical protein